MPVGPQEYHAQLEEMRVSIRQLEENLSAARRRSDLYESELKESRQTSEELKRKAADYQHRIQKVRGSRGPVVERSWTHGLLLKWCLCSSLIILPPVLAFTGQGARQSRDGGAAY